MYANENCSEKYIYYSDRYLWVICVSHSMVVSCLVSSHELTVGVLCFFIPFCLIFYSSEPTVIIIHNHIHFFSLLLSNVFRGSASSCCVVVSVYSFCVCKSKCVSVTSTGHAGQRVARCFDQSEHATSILVETFAVTIFSIRNL